MDVLKVDALKVDGLKVVVKSHPTADVLKVAAKSNPTAVAGALAGVVRERGTAELQAIGAAAINQAVKAIAIARGYATLEYDLARGTRGRRDVHAESLLCQLTGAEAAVVVNNNAAATMIVLAALAAGREVIVSRGELVEIGGGFRIPDVMAQSGAILREVGTTNKTRGSDVAAAISEKTALILRVHPSNFRIEGFTERPALTDLVALGKKFNIPVAEDLGSGHLADNSLLDQGQTRVRPGSDPEPPDRQLTDEQADALARLRKLADTRAFRVALLHGVTGSGKTEVYIRLSADVRASGRRVLMLVPEIALTPAAAHLFRQAFGERVAIQHSGLSDGERHDQWQRSRRGDIDIVVGTRAAVFAPLEQVGLIVVDEEHDASYKQDESPRYNGRDVAIVRAQRAGALVVLGSATPSMESYHNAMTGKYERVVLQRRVLDRPLASVSVVDMREEYADAGPDVILSRALREAIQARLDRQEQSLVLLNRRGFATAVFCRQCAGTIDCPNCSVSLVVHGEGNARRARCHYCNFTSRVPPACPLCAGPYLEQAGFGTERLEAEVQKAFFSTWEKAYARVITAAKALRELQGGDGG